MTRVRVLSAEVEFIRRPFVKPLRLSSGVISEITEARVSVTVDADGSTATGRGAIYLSDLWAWPDPERTPEERDAAMREYTTRLAAELPARTGTDGDKEAVHPLEAGLRLHDSLFDDDSPLPMLARLVCSSPLDAALHDATGIALNRSAFALYETDAPIPSADHHFPQDGGAVAAIRKMLRKPSATSLDATLVVGKGDDLADLEPWITERGYRVFKLKTGGRNAVEDAERTVAVYREACRLGAESPHLSVDSNCLAPNAMTIEGFLDILAATDPAAYFALDAIEQPTGRDIREHRFDWRRVAGRRPVLLDEGLTDWGALRQAEAQGWNGMAVKTCRGHSFSLVAAACAHRRGWTLTVMDLTNPGYAAIHSALLAAHLPGVTAIEMNAPQYTPAANAEWLPRLAALLEPTDGVHRLPETIPVGLGSKL